MKTHNKRPPGFRNLQIAHPSEYNQHWDGWHASQRHLSIRKRGIGCATVGPLDPKQGLPGVPCLCHRCWVGKPVEGRSRRRVAASVSCRKLSQMSGPRFWTLYVSERKCPSLGSHYFSLLVFALPLRVVHQFFVRFLFLFPPFPGGRLP